MNALRLALPFSQPQDPKWVQAKAGRYHRLISLDPEEDGLSRVGGVYVVWHEGIRPQWVYVGRSDDLAATFHAIAEDEEIMSFEVNGGIYVTWSPIRPRFRPGVVRYLYDTLKPLVDNPNLAKDAADPVAVIPPRSLRRTA